MAALAVFAAGLLATPAGASTFTPGAAGAGDPFFPRAGNGGYEVSRYLINLRFRPDRDRLVARTTIRAVATHDLSAFNLDFAGPRVRRVEVDGGKARFDEGQRELVVTPAAGIPAGASFRVEVAYAGRPRTIRDPDGTREGWFETDDGGYALGEPIGSLAWYPSNNIPTDKAKFEVTATVPRGLKAISNGALVDVRKRKRWTRFTWRTSERMATYLAMIAIGRFSLDRKPVSGIDSVVAIDPRHLKEGTRSLRVSAKIISFFGKLFGPYPFSETGAIIERTPPTIDYALETQTRPFYPSPPDPVTIAHELAHEWYGNSVTPARWPDIWLNEGFATWAEWRWLQRTGGPSTSKRLAEVLALPASSAFWDVAPANPGSAANLFHPAVYQRGAAALEVLRQRIGDVDFQAILREWAQGRRHGHGTTLEFIALAEARSGEELDPLFDEWLFQADKPAS